MERPIIMQSASVTAILAGQKTQTRRVCCFKAVTDALEGLMYRNDSQIVEAIIRKRYGTPCVEIQIEETKGESKCTDRETC